MKLTNYYFEIINILPKKISKQIYKVSNRILPDRRSADYKTVMKEILEKQVNGDYFEFGVYKGRSLVLFYYLAKEFGLKMRFFGFDSFEGLPEAEGNVFYSHQFSFSLSRLKKYLRKVGVESDVYLIQGFYSKSLTKEVLIQYKMKTASIIHIDCDLYVSTKEVLRFIEPLLQNGTIIIFDDWGSFNSNQFGEQRALNEFHLKHNFESLDYVTEIKAFRYVENPKYTSN